MGCSVWRERRSCKTDLRACNQYNALRRTPDALYSLFNDAFLNTEGSRGPGEKLVFPVSDDSIPESRCNQLLHVSEMDRLHVLLGHTELASKSPKLLPFLRRDEKIGKHPIEEIKIQDGGVFMLPGLHGTGKPDQIRSLMVREGEQVPSESAGTIARRDAIYSCRPTFPSSPLQQRKEPCRGPSVGKCPVFVFDLDSATVAGRIKALTTQRQSADSIPWSKRRIQPLVLTGEHPGIERQVVSNKHRPMKTLCECRGHVREAGSGRNHGSRDSMNVSRSYVSFGVYKCIPLIDHPAAPIECYCGDLDHMISVIDAGSLYVDRDKYFGLLDRSSPIGSLTYPTASYIQVVRTDVVNPHQPYSTRVRTKHRLLLVLPVPGFLCARDSSSPPRGWRRVRPWIVVVSYQPIEHLPIGERKVVLVLHQRLRHSRQRATLRRHPLPGLPGHRTPGEDAAA